MYQKQYVVEVSDDGVRSYKVAGYSHGIVRLEAFHKGSLYEFVWESTHGSTDLYRVWLIDPAGRPVGNVCYWLVSDRKIGDPFRFVLESIEIREGFRDDGLAKFLIVEVEKWVGETLHGSGHFTPLGYQSLKGLLPVADTSRFNNYGEEVVEFEDMSFVRDWDKMIPVR